MIAHPYILTTLVMAGIMVPFTTASSSSTIWSDPIELPVIAVAMANVDNHRILMWSGGMKDLSTGSLRISGKPGRTFATLWDPANSENAMLELVDTTEHDMFCPGTSILPNGQLMVTGGTNNGRVSFYDSERGVWTRGADMKIGRGYHANAVLSDGSVFVMGGSWFDRKGVAEYNYKFTPIFGWLFHLLRYHVFDWFFQWIAPWERKDGEIWDPLTDEWRVLENVRCEGSAVTEDKRGQYRDDNHFWLFQAPNGKIFHAGPSVMTHWITTEGPGSIVDAALRGTHDAMNVVGGASDYDKSPAYANAFVISLDEMDDTVEIRQVSDMNRPRAMMNSVVLPNGQVMVIGGNEVSVVFDDSKAVLSAELWDPVTESFTELPPMQIPRTYHSTALLMQDGRVLAAGGGLCGKNCQLNHFDAEILTPPYLFSNFDTGEPASRPEIVGAPSFAVAGDTIDVEVSVPVDQFSLVRLSAATHSVNTDLRRVPLSIISVLGNVFTLQIPANAAVSLPGTYFLFALDSNGVPSIATTISISSPADQ